MISTDGRTSSCSNSSRKTEGMEPRKQWGLKGANLRDVEQMIMVDLSQRAYPKESLTRGHMRPVVEWEREP